MLSIINNVYYTCFAILIIFNDYKNNKKTMLHKIGDNKNINNLIH